MTTELSLFPADESNDPGAPLAHRVRPESLDEFLGHEQLLAPGKPLRDAIERGTIASLVLWGPPGCGKTTLARLLARYTDREFVTFSAVTEGVPRVREIIREAEQRRRVEGRGTILFCDEIHRFNKAQQDAFLPSVEYGAITLIGATTENPSFELNSALLSRLRVFVLEPLAPSAIRAIIERAVVKLATERSRQPPELEDDALELLVRHADGDARRALNATEALLDHAWSEASAHAAAGVSATTVAAVLERRLARYDKAGEEHYNLISALHKAVRGSDVEGALYWLARMVDGGEDVLYLTRRVVRMAVEDIGLADPRALVDLARRQGYLRLSRLARRRACGRRGRRLPSARTEVEQRLHRLEPGAASRARASRGARADAHPQRADAAHERHRLRTRLPIRSRRRRTCRGSRISARRAARGQVVSCRGDAGYEKTLAERLAWLESLKSKSRRES